jgi:uncharacterized membrane protein YobD (UPF0266 family)
METKKNKFFKYILVGIISIVVFNWIVNKSGNSGNFLSNSSKAQIAQSFSGNGKDVKRVQLNSGLAIIGITVSNNTMTYTAGGNIVLKLENSDGSYYSGGVLFNEVGVDYSGIASINIKRSGFYLLTIETESKSNWTVSIN